LEVGVGLARALGEGLCKREELWVTSKLWCTFHSPEHVQPALQRTLKDLGLAYLDLYLIHFPIPLKYVDPSVRYPPEWLHDPRAPSPRMEPARVPLAATWGAMLAAQDAGLARAVGVCNFSTALLRDLINSSARAPEVLQVELHPYLQQEKLLRYCASEGIHVTGFSPLGAGSYVALNMATPQESALVDPVVQAIAARLGATPAQVVLAWAVQGGRSVVPKSTNPARIRENMGALALPSLAEEDKQAMRALDKNRRYNDPGVCA
jgi:D-xylose reductase